MFAKHHQKKWYFKCSLDRENKKTAFIVPQKLIVEQTEATEN
jgi:hypothetical protein